MQPFLEDPTLGFVFVPEGGGGGAGVEHFHMMGSALGGKAIVYRTDS